MFVSTDVSKKAKIASYTFSRLKKLWGDSFSEIAEGCTTYARAFGREEEQKLYDLISFNFKMLDGFQFFMCLVKCAAEVRITRPRKAIHEDTLDKFKTFMKRHHWYKVSQPGFFYLDGTHYMLTIRTYNKKVEINFTRLKRDGSSWTSDGGFELVVYNDSISVVPFAGGYMGDVCVPSSLDKSSIRSDLAKGMADSNKSIANLFSEM